MYNECVRWQILAPSVLSCVCVNNLSFKICVFQVVKCPHSFWDCCYCYCCYVKMLLKACVMWKLGPSKTGAQVPIIPGDPHFPRIWESLHLWNLDTWPLYGWPFSQQYRASLYGRPLIVTRKLGEKGNPLYSWPFLQEYGDSLFGRYSINNTDLSICLGRTVNNSACEREVLVKAQATEILVGHEFSPRLTLKHPTLYIVW